jgi:hypothetical protein
MITNQNISKGYVYIIINISMPGLVKVGKSTRSPEIRATELSQASGVPHSFQIVYQTLVDNCDLAEKEVHRFLNAFRENSNREFFRIPVNRAIDVLRKVISENKLTESDHEIDPYRFVYEEFHSAEALFEKVISNEKYWEQAKLHLKEGYLINWLKNKSEFDALVNAERYKSRKDDLDYYFSLIVFSIVPKDFIIFGYKISSVDDIRNYYEKEFEYDQGFLSLYLSPKLQKIYEGFLNSRGKTENQISKFLRFTNSSIDLSMEIRKEKLKKILEWKNDSSKFLHFDTISFKKVDFLLKKIEWQDQSKLLGIPFDITERAFSKAEKDVIESVKYLNEVKSLLYDSTNSPTKKKDLSRFVSKQEHLKEISYLTGSEYLCFLNCKYSMDDLKSIESDYVIPELLWDSILNSKTFFDFLRNRDYLLLLLGEIDEDETGLFVNNSYSVYFGKILKRYEAIQENFDKDLIISDQIFYRKSFSSFRKYLDETKRARNYFFMDGKLLVKKVDLEEKIKSIFEKYLVPLDLRDGLQAGDLKSINDFHSFNFPKIEKSYLDDRVINENLLYSFKNGFKKDFEDTMQILSKAHNKYSESPNSYFQNSEFNGVSKFSLEFIPTNQFLLTLSLPGELQNKLRSDSIDDYLAGLNIFFEYANFWIPKKTYIVLEDEFVLPESILNNLRGFNIDQYLKSVEFLISNGLEIINGLEKSSENLGVIGFLNVNWGLSKNPNDRKLTNNLSSNLRGFSDLYLFDLNYKYSYFENGRFLCSSEYNSSRSKIIEGLKDTNIGKACLIHSDHTFITKKDISDYRKKIGEDAFKYFSSVFKLRLDNYSDAKKILLSCFDKRLDTRISFLIKSIDLKFGFLPEELRKYIKDYLHNLTTGKISYSNSDLNFIIQMEESVQMNSILFKFKKKKFHSFLREHYHIYSPKYNFSSGILNYLNENS